MICPSCKSSDENHVHFGHARGAFIDCFDGQAIHNVVLSKQRYRCRSCGKTFCDPLPNVDDRHNMTRRLVEHIASEALSRPFTSVAADLGLDEKTVRNVFADHVADLESRYRFEPPSSVGFALVRIASPGLAVLNLTERTIFDILPNTKQPTLARFFKRLSEPPQAICLGAILPHMKKLAHKAFPDARIAVFPFSLNSLSLDAAEQVRRVVHQGLDTSERRWLNRDRKILKKREQNLSLKDRKALVRWETSYPAITAAYEAKEGLLRAFEAPSRDKAEERYHKWKAGLSPEIEPFFREAITTVDEWLLELLTWFDLGIEEPSLEDLADAIQQVHGQRGYSVQATRARILFDPAHHKTRKWGRKAVNFGPSISSLTEKPLSRKQDLALCPERVSITLQQTS